MVVAVGERRRGCGLRRGDGQALVWRWPGGGMEPGRAPLLALQSAGAGSYYQDGFWRGRSKIARATSKSHDLAWTLETTHPIQQ